MAERTPIQVEIGEASYLVGPLAPRPIFHIGRRLAPFFASLAPFLVTVDNLEKSRKASLVAADGSNPSDLTGDAPEDDSEPVANEPVDKAKAVQQAIAAGLPAVTALSEVLATMTDAQADYVLDGLLRGVKVVLQKGTGFAPMFQGDRMMYPNTPMVAQIELAGRVLWFNLESFFDALPSAFKDQVQKAAAQLIG